MLDIVFEWICWVFGQFILAVILVPMGVILAGYLVYILVMTIRELRKKSYPVNNRLTNQGGSRASPAGIPPPFSLRPRAAATRRLPPAHACGRSLFGAPKRKRRWSRQKKKRFFAGQSGAPRPPTQRDAGCNCSTHSGQPPT